MYRQYRLRQGCYRLCQEGGIHRVSVGIDVDQHRFRARRDDRVQGRAQRERHSDDLIAWPGAQSAQSQVQRRRSATKTDAKGGVAVGRELLLEARDFWTANEVPGLDHAAYRGVRLIFRRVI